MVTDLANEIGQCEDWDPESLHSPAQPKLPKPRRVDPSIPIAEARPMAVEIPLTGESIGRVDGFIDDLINVLPTRPRT